MKTSTLSKSISALTIAALASISTLIPLSSAQAHCQVPCGIFDDEVALKKMAENVETARKSVTEMLALADKTDPQSKQQFVRWVNTKEDHAVKTQQIALDHFLAQRIKKPADESGQEAYEKHLVLIHDVIIQAMKVKQNANLETVDALDAAVKAFADAYNAK